MKKRNLKSLKLNKKPICSFSIKGGASGENAGEASEEAQINWFVEGCLMPSVIQNTGCTCA